MANFIDVLKGKEGNLALGGVGASSDSVSASTGARRSPQHIAAASANESPAAAAARERAEAAKAQIEKTGSSLKGQIPSLKNQIKKACGGIEVETMAFEYYTKSGKLITTISG